MIDVARNPHSIAVLEDVIRLAHLYKLRFLHLHLSDDQLFTFPFKGITDVLENNVSYTRAELEGLVAYAALRGITIIPEIDLPGHSSRLRESAYLPGAKNDRDVASAEHFDRIGVLLDVVMDVFNSSPYFHIGGDESGAGGSLLSFLGRVQNRVRARGKRLIVWEGFHGAPTDVLPVTGPDRVIVAAWESSYNAPWDLLKAGYPIINASWKPLYVVGSHNIIHPGSSGGRKWSPIEMASCRRAGIRHRATGRNLRRQIAWPNQLNL
ncbi:MAG: family 20 glycosylhydrolase [Planctomycetes bacterium]|nr:family 20 glycosylhydrolase [Planctomycetota bacterium]